MELVANTIGGNSFAIYKYTHSTPGHLKLTQCQLHPRRAGGKQQHSDPAEAAAGGHPQRSSCSCAALTVVGCWVHGRHSQTVHLLLTLQWPCVMVPYCLPTQSCGSAWEPSPSPCPRTDYSNGPFDTLSFDVSSQHLPVKPRFGTPSGEVPPTQHTSVRFPSVS